MGSLAKHQVVAAFVHEIGRDDHGVRQQNSRRHVDPPIRRKQAHKPERISDHRVKNRRPVIGQSEGVFYQALC